MFLASDSNTSLMFCIEENGGKYKAFSRISDSSLLRERSSPFIGMNGIRILNGYVFYSNSFAANV